MSDKQGFATRAIHAGHDARAEPTGAVNTPIQLSTTFVQPDVAEPHSFDYSRGGNPTRQALEDAMADLEGGVRGFAFASGLAALDAVMRTMDSGDHIVAAEDAYGGSMRLLTKIVARHGIAATFVDTRDLDAVRAAMTPDTKWLLLESPTNPLLRISDIEAIAEIVHEAGARLIVDNTFMSPALQNPIALGADAVFHSATKYVGGHSDVLGGLLVVADEALAEDIHFIQFAAGAVLPPFDSYLLLRGLKTLDMRMRRHSDTAAFLADRLAAHPAVREVYFPGLESHQGHATNARQARGPGGMLSIRLADEAAARRLVKNTNLFQLAESLGAVESLIQIPALMTHASVPPEIAARTQLDPALVRISVGLEGAEDLWHDLETALAAT